MTFVYCGSDWTTEPTFIEWAQTLAPGILHDAMVWTSEHLRIFSNAGEGLAEQIRHNIQGHGAYLLGQEYRRAIWFYFPVALTIKTSLPLLLLPIVVALIRPRALWNWACLTALGLLLFSLGSRVQIGVRLMLPLLACLAVGAAAAFIDVSRSLGDRWRAVLIVLIGAGLVGNAVAAVRVWPEALCYTNAAWGGTRTGYRSAQRFELRLGSRSARARAMAEGSTASSRSMSGISGSIRGRRRRPSACCRCIPASGRPADLQL